MASNAVMPPPCAPGPRTGYGASLPITWRPSLPWAATILVIAPLIAIFGYLLYKGASSLNLAFFTQIPKPVGETGGGMANSILGSGILLGDRQPHGRAHRHRRRHLHRGVWPQQAFGQHGPLYRRRAQRRALDRHGHRHLHPHRRAAEAFLRACRWRRAGHHDDSHHHPHHRRDAADGASAMCARPLSDWASRTGVRFFPSRCAPRRPASSPAACWPLPGSPERPRRCSLPPSATSSGAPASIEPIAALPLQIFVYAISPYDEWHRLAWAGALVLIVLIVVSVALVRYVAGRGVLKGAS